MRIPKIYLETSVLNFVFADDAPDKRSDTLKLFEEIKNGRYCPFTSIYVTEETDKATEDKRKKMYEVVLDYKIDILQKTNEIKQLADIYVNEGIIPKRYVMDALHIAAATINNIDAIISWNFEHIVKRKTIIMTESVNLRNGYKKVEIYSPAQVVEYV